MLVAALFCGTARAEPVQQAITGNHPLTVAQSGDLLIAELRCGACHAGVEKSVLPEKTAPDLGSVGARISPGYLQRFLASPAAAHPGTTMPDLLASRSDEERNSIAEALTHFLVAQSQQTFQADASAPLNEETGQRLYHSVGCVACHGYREAVLESPPVPARNDALEPEEDPDEPVPVKKDFRAIAVTLDHVASKYSVKSLADFLFQPLRVRSSGRMPDMKLTGAESQAIAAYLVGSKQPDVVPLAPRESLVAAGKQHFAELNCAACHPLEGVAAAPLGSSLKHADFSRGCLSETMGRGPRYRLEPESVQAIVAALQADRQPDTTAVQVAQSLTAFRCIACHVRDEYGGVPEEYSPFFLTTEKNLGEDGRIPPPLTLLGAKLRPEWLKKVLFDGESVRPYMLTRMPQYGTRNLEHLPALFARLDVLDTVEMTIPSPESDSEEERQRERVLRKAGHELLGDKGVYCVACHNFNGKPGPVNKGIDLMTTYQRLQPGWFNSFVRSPGAFRPRIIMPYSWANGVAAHKTILDGNTDRQIEAIWYYLSLGTSAADPSGIRRVNTRLTVDATARIHRGRSRVAGYRGIAVGLPGKLCYAFNAETGTLSALWHGEFIDVDWNGQGSGGFHPAVEPARLPQDVSFVQLANEQAPWPLLPVTTKEERVNPNPLYPKNLGYQFRGYVLDEASVPTFLYRSGTIAIADRSTAARSADGPLLQRVLQFDSPERQSVWFRALAGEILQESERSFRAGRLRLTIPEVDATQRPVTDSPGQHELLLRLTVPQGQSSLEFKYELLQK